MEKVRLGKTSQQVSQVCLGCMLMGSTVDEVTSFAMLDRFTGEGGNFLDTANCYAWWLGAGECVGELVRILVEAPRNLFVDRVEAQGQVTQSIGRKTQLRGGIWGGLQCNPNGPTWFEVWSFADWGRFATTWTGIQLGFGQYYDCNEFGCNWRDFGGGQWWLKAGKM